MGVRENMNGIIDKLAERLFEINPESEWLQIPVDDGNEYDPFKEILCNDEKVLCDENNLREPLTES